MERFGHLAAPDARVPIERVRAEQEAELIFAQLARLLPTTGDAVDSEALNTILFALEDLEAVPARRGRHRRQRLRPPALGDPPPRTTDPVRRPSCAPSAKSFS